LGAVLDRLVHRSAEHLPDQPLRAVRPAAGLVPLARASGGAAEVPHPAVLQVDPPPAVSRLLSRLLGDAGDDRRPPAARSWRLGLHADRDPL
jgi:hypothetical protein